MQALEISVAQAAREVRPGADELAQLAAEHRGRHTDVNTHDTVRHWVPTASTFCYQTHIAISGQDRERFSALTETFFTAAAMPVQPWYPQFIGGETLRSDAARAPGVSAQQLALGVFDLGLPQPRCYRQLVSLYHADPDTAVIVARSVDQGPGVPSDARLAYTLAPNGEVLALRGNTLHWHHICCTPGAQVLPGRLDRWLINTLRRLGLDRQERNTYRDEALMLRDWLRSPDWPAAESAR